MNYVPGWLRLSEAVEYVAATANLSKEEAQNDLCRAIADAAVEIRAQLRGHATRPITYRKKMIPGQCFRIPSNIKPADLDWEESRPERYWYLQGEVRAPDGPWYLEFIEVSSADLDRCLCNGSANAKTPLPSKLDRRPKSRPAFERAQSAIKSLFPQAVPEQMALPNAMLCRHVGQHLKKLGLPDVKNDTILRAAGRRK